MKRKLWYVNVFLPLSIAQCRRFTVFHGSKVQCEIVYMFLFSLPLDHDVISFELTDLPF